MRLSVAIQMDEIESVDINADSTFALAEEAQVRGHQLYYYLVRDLSLKTDLVVAWGRSLEVIRKSGDHAILAGHGDDLPSLEYLAKDNNVENGNTIFTSGKEGLFSPGIPIGQVSLKADKKNVLLFSDISQISFVNINIGDSK